MGEVGSDDGVEAGAEQNAHEDGAENPDAAPPESRDGARTGTLAAPPRTPDNLRLAAPGDLFNYSHYNYLQDSS